MWRLGLKTKAQIKKRIFPILMSITMTIVNTLINTGSLEPISTVIMIIIQSSISALASWIFPAGKIGSKLAKRYFPDLNYLGTILISSIVPALYFTAIMTFSANLIQLGYGDKFWSIYLSSFARGIGMGYIASIFWNILLDKIILKNLET